MSSSKPFRFPACFYPIVDPLDEPRRTHRMLARAVLAAGAPLLQLRYKRGSSRAFLEEARAVSAMARAAGARLIVNDRADIALAVAAAGVHLGQDDLPPRDARRILGPDPIIGWSTHSLDQVAAAEECGVVDYIGFGPLFATTSKEHPDPVQGLEGLLRARERTALPIVAIGGVTIARIPEVLRAGADAVAMIAAIARAADPVDASRRALRSGRDSSPSAG